MAAISVAGPAERLEPHLGATSVVHRIVARGEVDGWVGFDEVVASSVATELPDVEIDPDAAPPWTR